MSGKMRLFYAVEVPAETRSELETFCQGIDRNFWRPVKPEQMHITLAFMGEVPEDELEKVIQIGENAAARFAEFSLELSDTGVFPESDEPRVLFVNVLASDLVNLALALRKNLGSLADQKKVRPHLTLARRKGERARKDLRKIRGGWLVKSFSLFKSTLTDSGADHELIRRFNLK